MPELDRKRYVIATGFAFSEPDVNFDANKPFRACLLCGRVFQPSDEVNTVERREGWAVTHAKRCHTEREHHLLYLSGLTMTPEAAHKLAAFGLIPVSDMVLNEEAASALMESHPTPEREVERY